MPESTQQSHLSLDHEKMQQPPKGFTERSKTKPNLPDFETYQNYINNQLKTPMNFSLNKPKKIWIGLNHLI